MSTKRVFLIHGWDARPDNHWFPYLSLELKANGFEVNAPQMPNAAEPKVKEWTGFLKDYVGKPDTDTYFVGHSLGCITIARYLAELSVSYSPLKKGALPSSAGGISQPQSTTTLPPRRLGTPFINGDKSSALADSGTSFRKGGIRVGGCVFVAGFSGRFKVPEISEFYTLPFDVEQAKKHCERFVMIFSDNDPTVPLEQSISFAKQLGAKTILERGKGHFTARDNVTALPSALNALLRMQSKDF